MVTTKKLLRFFLITLLFLEWASTSFAQTNQCPICWVPITRHRFVPGVNISPQIKGYAEYLPSDYYQNQNKRFPLIIFVHGIGSVGDGQSVNSLCYAVCGALPMKIEERRYSEVVYNNSGQAFSFIVLTPQYGQWPGTGASDLQAFINYAVANYRVDINRIYLTGLSSGAELIMNYMSSSATEANRIAAVVPLATCNSSNNNGANYMGSQGVRFWGLHCQADNTCGAGNTVNWATAINNYSPSNNPMAKYTLTPVYNAGFPHDIWYATYDSSWKENNKNITQWMIQYSRNFQQGTLPASFSAYDVVARNREVVAEWTTSQESNTDYFIVERAGADLQFQPIGRIKAAGEATTSTRYSFKDPQPIRGTSYYRLALVNRDGVKELFEIRKVQVKDFGASFTLTPVPARKNLVLTLNLEQTQQLQFIIRDINGRTLQSWSGNFSSGYANLNVDVSRFNEGVYYLSIQGRDFSESRKFIKQ